MASTPTTSPAPEKTAPPANQHVNPLIGLWQIVTRVDRSKINLWQALRNTAGGGAPLVGGLALGMAPGGPAKARGALDALYFGRSEPYTPRAQRMLGSSAGLSVGGVAWGV